MRCKVTALLRNIKHFHEVSFPGHLISLCRTAICAPVHRAFTLARIYIMYRARAKRHAGIRAHSCTPIRAKPTRWTQIGHIFQANAFKSQEKCVILRENYEANIKTSL